MRHVYGLRLSIEINNTSIARRIYIVRVCTKKKIERERFNYLHGINYKRLVIRNPTSCVKPVPNREDLHRQVCDCLRFSEIIYNIIIYDNYWYVVYTYQVKRNYSRWQFDRIVYITVGKWQNRTWGTKKDKAFRS